jgi:sugar transferase (PEP-CTERM/EpsH1 system associated)
MAPDAGGPPMRILMLAHRIPYPPHTGDKLRAYQVARHLAARHALTLGVVVDEAEDRPHVATLRREIPDLEAGLVWKPGAVARGLLALATGGCLSVEYFRSRRLARRLAARAAAGPWDLVYVSSSPMARYAAALAGSAPVVLDLVDVDSDKWIQYAARRRPPVSWLHRLEGRRLRRYEAEITRWGRLAVLTTPAEEALLRSFAPWARTAVVPNGVDLDYYAPGEPATAPTLIFTGAMDYFPNADAVEHFCEEILPRVARAVPGTRFLIVGLNPTPSVRRLAARPGVTVTGAVPDVRPYYRESSVCVAPLRVARGVQNKVLQAMAMGVPVVATAAAAQGIGARPGQHLLVASGPEAFASAVIDLLRDPARRAALGRAGRAFVEASHSWRASLDALHDRLLDVAGAPRVPARRLA